MTTIPDPGQEELRSPRHPPERFGNCRVTGTLGDGSLSTVYRAVQEPLGREVAVKALKPSIAITSSFAGQLEREAAVLAELSHPNVAVLHELVKSETELYLVLEIVPGPSLADLLSRRSPLPPEAAAVIAMRVLMGLGHANERGVVHRDVKPQNIVLGIHGEVKLVDFGIAQTSHGPRPREEPESLAFGTPAYMSPEQILGERVDARSDLFSLGVVLYQMLAGVRPFDEGEKREGAHRIRRAPAVPLARRVPDVPRPLDRITMRLLEKLPGDRYGSAASVEEELREFLGSRVRGSLDGVIARTLRDAGFGKGTESPAFEITLAVPPPLRPVYAGFFAILLAGVGVGGGIQWADRPERERAHAGEAPLELAPKNRASLRVLATPWAQVWVDGQYVDTTPFARAIPLSPGTHFVTLRHPEAPPEQRVLVFASGQTETLDVKMKIPERKPEPVVSSASGDGKG